MRTGQDASAVANDILGERVCHAFAAPPDRSAQAETAGAAKACHPTHSTSLASALGPGTLLEQLREGGVGADRVEVGVGAQQVKVNEPLFQRLVQGLERRVRVAFLQDDVFSSRRRLIRREYCVDYELQGWNRSMGLRGRDSDSARQDQFAGQSGRGAPLLSRRHDVLFEGRQYRRQSGWFDNHCSVLQQHTLPDVCRWPSV